MLTTFIYSLKVMIRDKSNLLWAVAFPLVLSTLFYSVFSSLDESYAFDPVPVIVVDDANYRLAESFVQLLDAMSGQGGTGKATAAGNQRAARTDGSGAEQIVILVPEMVASESEARSLLASGEYFGYILVDADGMPAYFMDSRWTGGLDVMENIRQSIVISVLDRYIQDYDLIVEASRTHPEFFADSGWLESLLEEQTYVTKGSITAHPPSDALRYYYAALAFSCMQMMSFGLTAVDRWKANTSALGARRALGGQSWVRSLAPNLLAAWCLALMCVTVGFLYIRFGFKIDFFGKEPYCLLVLAIATLLTTLIGALLGATTIHFGVKSGMTAAITCLLSLFAGLYGPASQQLGDNLARDWPILSDLNPARQVSDILYSLYYYDSFDRMYALSGIMVMMALVFFAVCILAMRRQRFNSL